MSTCSTHALRYTPPLDSAAMLAFMAMRTIRGVEQVSERGYARNIRLGTTCGAIEIRFPEADSGVLDLRLYGFDKASEIECVLARVRHMFDLDADLPAIQQRLGADAQLAPLLAQRPGLRLPAAWDPFEYFVRAVLGQQISVKAATTLATRLAEHGPSAPHLPELPKHFPNATEFLAIDLAKIGLTRARQETLRRLAEAVATGALSLSDRLPLEAFVQQATALKGIGPWTAHYVAMRGLKYGDAFPVGDLGLLKALAPEDLKMRDRQMLTRAEPWRPYRAYATLHLWQSLSDAERAS